MAKKGFLKIAKTKTSKKGNPFVSLLILDGPEDEDGIWMSLFDMKWAGGTENSPSPYDIRPYADKDDPAPVVYEAEQNGDFWNCLRIRPADEKWEDDILTQQPELEVAVTLHEGFELIRKGLKIIEEELL